MQTSHLTIEHLDATVADADGCQYGSMNYFRNQVGLDTFKLMMLLQKIPSTARRDGNTAKGDALTLYPIKDVDHLFWEHGIVRRGHDIVIENQLESVVFKKVHYASRDFFKHIFHLSDKVFDEHI